MAAKAVEGRANGHLDVLGSIPPQYRKAVLDLCERRHFAKGKTVWTQGERADYVAFLFSGKAMSSYQSRNGKTGTTGFWCAGDLIGAGDMGEATTRQMTVRCLEPCVIYTLSFERFNDLVRRFPELAQTIIRAMAVRLRWVSLLAVTLETQSAFERICAVLLALSERFGTACNQGVLIDLSLTNDNLAAIAGVSRQFTNSTLHELRDRGLLVNRKRSLIVTNPAALESLAHRS
ncbi:MAG TPA: Crp/Fnr family transcriptional regulator [Burkholderiales bacterium]